MRLVVSPEPGVVELNYTWLPVWIGINTPLKNELEQAIADKLVGRKLTEETLDEAHELVVDFFAQRFPALKGLRDFLDSIKFVTIE